MAEKKRKTEFAGTGCLVQGVGLLLLFVWPIGTIIGLGLLIYGSFMSTKLICSNCGNQVVKTSKICPHCNVPLT